MESMSAGVPVIATNWSGPTAFINAENGLPLRVHSFIPAE
jgi:glycosyltransferase involved in cell wall biosynthesis